jgi:hypothetical protein
MIYKKKESIMNRGIETIIYPVRDITRAKKMFSRLLDVEPYVDELLRWLSYRKGNRLDRG